MSDIIQAWERSDTEIRFPHVKAENHRVEYVTGAIAAGPMNDGPTMLVLYREVLPPLTEIVTYEHADGGGVYRIKNKGVVPVEGALREDVVTLVLTRAGVEQLARVLATHLKGLPPLETEAEAVRGSDDAD